MAEGRGSIRWAPPRTQGILTGLVSVAALDLHFPVSQPTMSDDNISEKHRASTHEALKRIQTADSVLLPIPRDAFEKLYLTPKMPAAGNLRRTFGNPTPIALLGFLLAATPGAMQTMGWRGSGGNGGAIL